MNVKSAIRSVAKAQEEHPEISKKRCINALQGKTKCSLCQDVCSKGCILSPEKGEANWSECENCGICVAVCPAKAIAHGSIEVKAQVTNIVREDTIDMFHGWEKANVNLVHARDFDPISGFPSYKEGLCDIRKL